MSAVHSKEEIGKNAFESEAVFRPTNGLVPNLILLRWLETPVGLFDYIRVRRDGFTVAFVNSPSFHPCWPTVAGQSVHRFYTDSCLRVRVRAVRNSHRKGNFATTIAELV